MSDLVHKQVDIPEAELKRLYLEEGLGGVRIAKRYGCAVGTVYGKLERLGIKRRSNENVATLEPSNSLVYVLFALRGDGYVAPRWPWRISLAAKDKRFVESVATNLTRIGLRVSGLTLETQGRKAFRPGSTVWRVYCNSRTFCEFYHGLTLEDWVRLGKQFPWDALRGWFEAEGHCAYSDRGGLRIEFANEDEQFQREVTVPLVEQVGFRASVVVGKAPNRKPIFRVYLLGRTPEKEEFLRQLNPCTKYPPYDYCKPKGGDPQCLYNFLSTV